MPPTNYIWMRTNIKHELIGVYEWLNGEWHRIKFGGDSDYKDVYSKTEIDYLLQWTEQEILRKLIEGVQYFLHPIWLLVVILECLKIVRT